MTPEQAVEHYGSQANLARAVQLTDAAVYIWVKQGFIPYDRQCQIQIDSGGALVARREDARPLAERAA